MFAIYGIALRAATPDPARTSTTVCTTSEA